MFSSNFAFMISRYQVFQVLQTAFNYFPSSSQRLGNFKISLIMPQKVDCRNFRNWTDYWYEAYPKEISSVAGEICHFDLVNHDDRWTLNRVSVQGVKSLGGHFACLCREFDFYDVKKNNIIFQKEKGNTFKLLIIFIVKSLQKEQNSTNLLL